MKTICSIRILPGQRALALDVHGHSLFETGLLELMAERAAKDGYQAEGAMCEIDSMERFRIVKREGKWATERS